MTSTSPELRNIRQIVRLEREKRGTSSRFDRMADWISGYASRPSFIALHLLWFSSWIALNALIAHPFDAPPFNLLMLAVSLEAIILTAFVLRAQSRMSQQVERRADIDLQINLLAEQELTAILRVLCSVGEHVGIDVASCDPRVEQFRAQTDVRVIAAELDSERAAVDKGGR